MFDQILIPTDGSKAVQPAVEMALDLAETHDATLHVLFIVDQPASVSGTAGGFSGVDNLLNAIEEEGHQATGSIKKQAEDRDIETKAVVRSGNPQDDILTYAEENGIELIIMGTHGRTGVKRALLGSVTENVVRHAEIPVMTVHREPEK